MKTAIITLDDYSAVKGGTEVFVQHLQGAFPDSDIFRAPSEASRLIKKLGIVNEYRSWKVGSEFKNEGYDAIFRNCYAGWNIKTKDPIVNVFHFTYKGFSHNTMFKNTQSKIISPFFENICLKNGIAIAVSKKVQNELRKYYHKESQVIENAVPDIFQKIPKEKAREHLGIEECGTMGIFVGRADGAKGFDIVRKIAKKERILCITPNKVENNGNMLIKNNVEYEEMPWHYAAADYLIFPSRYESFGYSIIEAMKCGIPVVASRTGVLEDMDSEQVGVIVDIGDEEGFAKGIEKVIKKGIKPSSDVVKRFSIERFQREYHELLEERVF